MDARPLGPRPTGIGRYLEGLLGAWLDLWPKDEIVLLSPRPVEPGRLRGRVETPHTPVRVPGTVWLQTLAPRLALRAGADLFFGPLGVLPIHARLPGVMTVHDLTPILSPAWHNLRNRAGFAPFLGPSVRQARKIAAVSEATRRDLVARYPDAAAKVEVVHNGVSPMTPPAGLPPPNGGRPYVLYLGTLEPRKNLERLVSAMEGIWDRRPDFPDLVLAGGSGWGLAGFARRLAASRHTSRIRRAGYVGAEEAIHLLAHARLLAYPSLYEGFGLPPLEAMALGTVVVGSSSSSLPEVLGDVGLLPNPESVEEIAAAIERAEQDEVWRVEARRKGLERAGLFTWKRAAEKMRELFERALA